MDFKLAQQEMADHCLVTLTGTLDIHTVNTVWAKRHALFATKAPVLTFDLQHMTHCDSSTVALFIALIADAKKQDKQLCFINMPTQFIAIIKVCGVEALLPTSSR